MKTVKLLILSLPIWFSGCIVRTNITPQDDAQLLVYLENSTISTLATTSLPNENDDTHISTLLLYVFDSQTQELELIYEATSSEISLGKIVVSLTTGSKDFYLVANYDTRDLDRLYEVEQFSDLKYQSADLYLLEEGNFMMVGRSLGYLVDNSKNQRVDICLRRAAARITINQIKANFPDEVQYNHFCIDSIYLINAIALSSYADTSVVFSSGKSYDKVPDVNFAYQNYDIFESFAFIDNNNTFTDSYPNGAHYYAYQNLTTNSPTLLVLSGHYTKYSNRVYYTFAIISNGVLSSNHTYELDITLYGEGTKSIEQELSGAQCTFKINDWNNHDSSITFD